MNTKRRRIVDTARVLFQEQGYAKTTITQIVEASGFQPGSIYHFFKNKEEIFMATVLDREIELREIISRYYEQNHKEVGGAYIYCMICYLIFYSSEHYDNMLDYNYYSYHLSRVITQISKQTAERNLQWFAPKDAPSTVSYEQMYQKTLAMSGVIYAFLTDIKNRHYIPFRSRIRTFFTIALTTYGVAPEEIAQMTCDDVLDSLECDARAILDGFGSSTLTGTIGT